ncbi:MAG TPA: NYN domain-containing protein [Acidimicrobiia bacterium]
MTNDEERIALFLDYENLAIGAREQLHRSEFDFRPVADALAERGRVVVRRAYADWSRFDEDRRMLTRHHVELIEIPQRMGSVRKNAADIKMAVDAIELCFERDYITTFVLGTGDSDFTPLVHKLRELNRRVIGIGVEASTSALLPPACDEFLFYERLEGVEPAEARRVSSRTSRAKRPPVIEEESIAEDEQPTARGEEADLGVLVTQTLSGISRSAGGPVLASMLKRAILRKDPTFSETTYGFRGFSELLRHLEEQGAVALTPGPGQGDPEVSFPTEARDEQAAFALLRSVVDRLGARSGPLHLSGLKTQLRKVEPDFSEKRFGYGGFLQFCKAARARGLIEMDWDEDADDYVVRPGPTQA